MRRSHQRRVFIPIPKINIFPGDVARVPRMPRRLRGLEDHTRWGEAYEGWENLLQVVKVGKADISGVA